MSEHEFHRSVDRLVGQVSHWQAARWTAASGQGGTRAERVHGLVQRLADLAAEAEGRPSRPVPRVGDLTLPDQLRVVARDLSAAGATEETLAAAGAAVDAVRRDL